MLKDWPAICLQFLWPNKPQWHHPVPWIPPNTHSTTSNQIIYAQRRFFPWELEKSNGKEIWNTKNMKIPNFFPKPSICWGVLGFHHHFVVWKIPKWLAQKTSQNGTLAKRSAKRASKHLDSLTVMYSWEVRLDGMMCVFTPGSCAPSLKLTAKASSPLKSYHPKWKPDRLPTIHFQGRTGC